MKYDWYKVEDGELVADSYMSLNSCEESEAHPGMSTCHWILDNSSHIVAWSGMKGGKGIVEDSVEFEFLM